MEHVKVIVAAFIICGSENAGGLANGNMFGNFARWNEPSRGASGGESSKKVDYSLHVSQQPSNTGGGTSSSSFSSFQQNTMTRTFPGESSNGRLHIQVYRALMDVVVLDWTISLADKDKMKACAVTYSAKEANETTTVDPFMPKTRTFLLEHLHPGQIYQFNMTCRNEVGDILKSDLLEFATLDPRPVQQLEPTAEWNSDYLNEMNPLPAISKSVHQSNSIKLSSSSLSRSKFSQNKISPHTVLGISCAIFGLIVITITLGLAFRRYFLHKRTQTRLWELHTVPEMEDQSVMSQPPTFINLPPPYSEQPSPMYNICQNTAAATLSTSSYTSSSIMTTGNGQQQQYCELHLSRLNLGGQVGCCYHHHICTSTSQNHKPEESTTDDDGDKSIETAESST